MKKLLMILVLGLLWCNLGFAKCIEGNCVDGQGTYTYANGSTYVGEFKNSRRNGQGTYTGADGIIKKGIWKSGGFFEPN